MSPETVHYFNMLVGVGVILLQVLSLLAVVFLIFRKENRYLSFIKDNFIQIGFFLSISALAVSTIYSEVIGYLPCFHCWVQRIFIFPQAFLFAVAWIKKDRNVFWYSLPLTILGLADALYLNYIYNFAQDSAPCDASGVSCVQHLVSEFGGYISIPMLSLSGFVALLVVLAVSHFYKKPARNAFSIADAGGDN